MKSIITIDIPYQKKLPYTLYVNGYIDIDPLYEDDRSFVHFHLKEDTVFVLFYTFKSFRRAYIVAPFNDVQDVNPITLPGVNGKLKLIYKASGRRVDNLKRAIYLYLKRDSKLLYTFRVDFWYRLAGLVQYFGAKKSDLMTLYNKFITC